VLAFSPFPEASQTVLGLEPGAIGTCGRVVEPFSYLGQTDLLRNARRPAERTDEELIGRYRDLRSAEDFNELVRRYHRDLYRYLVRYLGGATQADDVLQNTFLQVHAKCHQFKDGRPARPWLYAIATHQAIDALREAGRRTSISLDRAASAGGELEPGALVEVLVGDEPSPHEGLEQAERQQWVRDSVARLPEPLRQVLILAYYQNLRYSEIVEVLGIPLGTVKSRLHVALVRLKAMTRAAHRINYG
jgi:RNA polymerase sigma-70 factor (ECF subfamily)